MTDWSRARSKETPVESTSDDQLVQNLQRGDMDAFAELYQRYKRHIFTFCLKLTGNRQSAEDATHDTFVKMHGSIRSLIEPSAFRTWLFSIARNHVFNTLAKHRGNGTLGEDDVSTSDTPYASTEKDDTATIIAACINALKLEYKEVLVLREYEQYSYEEIAFITGDTENSVKSRLFKARRALADKLKPYFKDQL